MAQFITVTTVGLVALGYDRGDGGDFGDKANGVDVTIPRAMAAGLVYRGKATVKAISAPTVTSSTPSTFILGTGKKALIIVGANFTPDSKVLFNSVIVPTLYVSATLLVAVVDSTGLTATTYNLLVRSYKLDANAEESAVNQAAATVITVTAS